MKFKVINVYLIFLSYHLLLFVTKSEVSIFIINSSLQMTHIVLKGMLQRYLSCGLNAIINFFLLNIFMAP